MKSIALASIVRGSICEEVTLNLTSREEIINSYGKIWGKAEETTSTEILRFIKKIFF